MSSSYQEARDESTWRLYRTPPCAPRSTDAPRLSLTAYWVAVFLVEEILDHTRQKRIFFVSACRLIGFFAQEPALLTIGACTDTIFVPVPGCQVLATGFSGTPQRSLSRGDCHYKKNRSHIFCLQAHSAHCFLLGGSTTSPDHSLLEDRTVKLGSGWAFGFGRYVKFLWGSPWRGQSRDRRSTGSLFGPHPVCERSDTYASTPA